MRMSKSDLSEAADKRYLVLSGSGYYGSSFLNFDRDSNQKSSKTLQFISSISGERSLAVEEDLGHGFVRLKVAEAERRQALQDVQTVEDIAREMIRNSRDAGATIILLATHRERGRRRHLTILDDGAGIPLQISKRIFEPRVTSRADKVVEDLYGVHGRGMALFSILTMCESLEIVSTEVGSGSSMKIIIDTEKVAEKADQSKFPKISVEENGFEVKGGLNNIPKLLMHFAIEHYGDIDVCFGSYAAVLSRLIRIDALNKCYRGAERVPIWKGLSLMKNAFELADKATEIMGHSLSERTAYRVLAGEIAPATMFSELLERKDRFANGKVARRTVKGYGDKIYSKLENIDFVPEEEFDNIGSTVLNTVRECLKEYEICFTGKPKVKKFKGKLVVEMEIEEKER